MRGKAEATHGLLDAPLVVEVRDTRPLVRRSHGCVDVMFDAGFSRQRRGPLAFRLACQATQMETRAPKRLRHRSALLACHSGDENRSIVCHGLSSFAVLTPVPDYIPG